MGDTDDFDEALNRLSPDLEVRYQRQRFQARRLVPIGMCGFLLAGAGARLGIYLGQAEILGRVLMCSAAVSVLFLWWRPARPVVFWLVGAACFGKAAAYLTFDVPNLDWRLQINSAMFYASIGLVFCCIVSWIDLILEFGARRGE